MIEIVNLAIQMKVKLEVESTMQKFGHSFPELTRVSYLGRNERYVEVSFGFYDSSMIMISGRPYVAV